LCGREFCPRKIYSITPQAAPYHLRRRKQKKDRKGITFREADIGKNRNSVGEEGFRRVKAGSTMRTYLPPMLQRLHFSIPCFILVSGWKKDVIVAIAERCACG
jgi:hypothetical protein